MTSYVVLTVVSMIALVLITTSVVEIRHHDRDERDRWQTDSWRTGLHHKSAYTARHRRG